MRLGILLLTVRIEMAPDLGSIHHQATVNKVHQLAKLRIVFMDRLLQLIVIVQQTEVKLARIARSTLYVFHLFAEHTFLKHVYQFLCHIVVDILHTW